MIEPFIIEPTMMKDSADCGICCLKMLLGVSYAEIITAIPKRHQKNITTTGVSIPLMVRVARRLGHVLEYHDEDFNPDYVGALDVVRIANEDEGHMVMYMSGVVYNPADGLLFTDLDTFLNRGKWKVNGFLFRRRMV